VLELGSSLVQKKAMRNPRSMMRALRMKRITRTKNTSADRMRTRSSQSDFSSAVMSSLEVPMKKLSVSCAVDVDWRVAVDASAFSG